MIGVAMIQKVNGVRMLIKVLQHPTYEEVFEVIQAKHSLMLEIASYNSGVESTGKFELADVRNLRPMKGGGFQFFGSIVGMDVDAHPDDSSRSVVYVKSGRAKVSVDADGADLEFIINMSLHVM